MASPNLHTMVEQLRRAVGSRCGGCSDGQLLDRYLSQHDDLAFEVLIWRHGTMVLGVCQRVLQNIHAAEDAFQATFLVFVQKAHTIGTQESVGSWLYKVAYRVALRVRDRAGQRRPPSAHVESLADPAADDPVQALARREFWPILDEEVHRLPVKYRTPFVLYHLEGRDYAAIAQEIGSSKGTVSNRLAKAQDLLKKRLIRRGVTLGTGWHIALIGESASASVTVGLVGATVKAGGLFAAGESVVSCGLSPEIETLAKAILMNMKLKKVLLGTVLLLGVNLLLGGGWLSYQALATHPPGSTAAAKPPRSDADDKPKAGDGWQVRATVKSDRLLTCSAFAPNGTLMATGDVDGKVKLWDAATGKPQAIFAGQHQWEVNFIAYAPDGSTLATASSRVPNKFGQVEGGSEIKLWDLASKKLIATWPQPDLVRCLSFTPDSKTLVFTRRKGEFGLRQYDGLVILWDVKQGKELADFNLPPSWKACSLAISPDGKTLALAGNEESLQARTLETGEVKLWDLAAKKERTTLPCRMRKAYGVVFSPDGKLLVACGTGLHLGEFRALLGVWDATTLKEKGTDQFPVPEAFLSMAFTADSKTLAIVGGQPSASFGAMDHISAATGQSLAVVLWEIASGQKRSVLEEDSSLLQSVSFGPHDRTMAVLSKNGVKLLAVPHSAEASVQEMTTYWQELASKDASKAYHAFCRLVANRKQTPSLVRSHVQPVPAAWGQRVNRLVADLQSDEFPVRQMAEKELEQLGARVVPALKNVLAASPPLKVRTRIEQLVERFGGPIAESDLLRLLRAIEVLEHLSTTEAKAVLETLAKGAPEARLTEEAQASLGRLAKRPATMP